jgi:hypothetical protein
MNMSHHLTSQLASERQRDLVAGGAAARPAAAREPAGRRPRLLVRAVLWACGVRRAPARKARAAQRAGC